jgi:hypothetical protein
LVLARAAHSGPKFTINSAPKFTSNSAPKFTSNSALHARRQSHHHSPRLTSFLLPSRLPISSAKGRSRPAPASPRAAQHRPGTTSSSSTDSMPRIYPILLAPPDPFNVAPGQATNPWRRGWLSRRCARASVGSCSALRRDRQTASRAWPMQLGVRSCHRLSAGENSCRSALLFLTVSLQVEVLCVLIKRGKKLVLWCLGN